MINQNVVVLTTITWQWTISMLMKSLSKLLSQVKQLERMLKKKKEKEEELRERKNIQGRENKFI